jgi:hypothetical protein
MGRGAIVLQTDRGLPMVRMRQGIDGSMTILGVSREVYLSGK